MGRIAVERIEVDALGMATEDSDDSIDPANFTVRNRDSIADGSRAEPLAFGQHTRDRVSAQLRELGSETPGQLMQDRWFRLAPQLRQNHFLTEDFSDFHCSEAARAGSSHPLLGGFQIFRGAQDRAG